MDSKSSLLDGSTPSCTFTLMKFGVPKGDFSVVCFMCLPSRSMKLLQNPKSMLCSCAFFSPNPNKKLSGLMSRWIKCLLCIDSINFTSWYPIPMTILRESVGCFCLKSDKESPKRENIMMLFIHAKPFQLWNTLHLVQILVNATFVL